MRLYKLELYKNNAKTKTLLFMQGEEIERDQYKEHYTARGYTALVWLKEVKQ